MSKSELHSRSLRGGDLKIRSKKTRSYLDKIDPLVRNTIGSIHTDVDFAIISYLMENKESTFANIGKGLRIDKNATAYSLRKMVLNGVVVNYHETFEGNARGQSTYGLSSFTRILFDSAANLLQGTPSVTATLEENAKVMFEALGDVSKDKEMLSLYKGIITETADYLYRNVSFFNQIGRISVFPKEDALHAIASDKLAWNYLNTALNLALEKLSTEIHLQSVRHNVTSELMKLMLYSQIVGYTSLSGVLDEFRALVRKTWEESRAVRLREAEDLLKKVEARWFDSLKDLKLSPSRMVGYGGERQQDR